ncbi:Unknown protein [Striga hermonthica]|uniref:Josephin-like protein n=1 Tax=Striga hermonthica TaxID=68872 RepID=A0A9N7RJ72_STRHE|nr:Unknown protein [Striga hermonthica]
MSKRVCFSPKHGGAATKDGGYGGTKKKAIVLRIWIFRRPRFSFGDFFRNVGSKVSKALPAMPGPRRCSGRVASLARSRSYAETIDSQRAEAIEDCIEFLNNPSLQRSSSVSSSC